MEETDEKRDGECSEGYGGSPNTMAVSRFVSGNGIDPTSSGCVAAHNVCAISLRTCEVMQKRSHRAVVRQTRHVNTVSDIENAPAAPKRAQEIEKTRGGVLVHMCATTGRRGGDGRTVAPFLRRSPKCVLQSITWEAVRGRCRPLGRCGARAQPKICHSKG